MISARLWWPKYMYEFWGFLGPVLTVLGILMKGWKGKGGDMQAGGSQRQNPKAIWGEFEARNEARLQSPPRATKREEATEKEIEEGFISRTHAERRREPTFQGNHRAKTHRERGA